VRRIQKLAVVVVIGTLVAVLMSTACVATKEEQVVYNRNGNALIFYGGDKTTTVETQVLLPTELRSPTKTLSASRKTYYGNAYVKTQFTSAVECDIWFSYPLWAEVAGTTYTYWGGSDPQYYSSRIQLAESWTFNGVSVSVSYPPGVQFSGSSRTIEWYGEDTSGDHWMMTHIYSGLRGESWIALTSVRQGSYGSHYFETTSTWVSAYATDGCSTA